MSLRDCIETAFNDGEISAEERAELNGTYDRFERQYRLEMDPVSAAAQAGRDTFERLKMDAAEKKRRAYLQAAIQKRIAGEFQGFRNRRGQADVGQALLEKLEPLQGGVDSVVGRQRAIIGQAHARLEEMIHAFRKTAIGTHRDPAAQDDVVRALFGERVDDPAAKALAASWSEVAEDLRRRFNAAGGMVGELDGWGLPQSHDAMAVRGRGFNAWAADIFPRLDPARMRDPLTGKPMTPEDVRASLQSVYNAIVSEGLDTLEPSSAPMGKGALWKRRADHRFLVFKSADDWMAYSRDYGAGEPYAVMMNHITVMARDIAAMEVLGPNPRATLTWMQQVVQVEAAKRMRGAPALMPERSTFAEWTGAKDADAATYAAGLVKRSEDMWAHISGATGAPVNVNVASGFAIARSLVTAAALGSAVLSSVTDVGTQMLTRAFNGLPVMSTVSDVVALFRPQEAASRRDAIAAGLIADSAMNVFNRAARHAGALKAMRETSALIADRVMAAGLLTPWTIAGRHAFGLAFMRETANLRHLKLGDLPAAFGRMLERYGFDAAAWDALRSGPVYEREGVAFLRPADLARRDGPAAGRDPGAQGELDVSLDAAMRELERGDLDRRRIAERYLDMILAETEYAVPAGTIRAKSLLQGGGRVGDVGVEVRRSMMQFKTFGVSIILQHGYRMFGEAMAGRRASLLQYGLMYASTMVIGGALALQLKDLAKGRDPRDMTSSDFWMAAMMQGGGLGVFGDFLYASTNQLGGGFEAVALGPLAGRVSDFLDLTAGNALGVAEGEPDDNFGRELVRFLKGSTPGGSLWYARLAAERLWWEELQRLVDPDADAAFDRMASRLESERNQGFWWAPGEAAPSGLPDAGAAIGGESR